MPPTKKTPANQAEDNDIRVFSFRLIGTTPLLMHADDVEQADGLDAWRKDPAHKGVSKAGDDRSPPWTWKTYCYSDGKYISVPADNLMAALRYAGSQLTLKKQKTFKAATQCGLVIRELHCPVQVPIFNVPESPDNPESGIASGIKGWRKVDADAVNGLDGTFAEQAQAVKELGFKLFVKRAPVGTSKHVRVRPRFEHWMLEGTIEVAMPEFTTEVLTKLWTIAGNYAGLCDWRPASPKSPGPFGRFQAELEEITGQQRAAA